jgi:hypothetical protein
MIKICLAVSRSTVGVSVTGSQSHRALRVGANLVTPPPTSFGPDPQCCQHGSYKTSNPDDAVIPLHSRFHRGVLLMAICQALGVALPITPRCWI